MNSSKASARHSGSTFMGMFFPVEFVEQHRQTIDAVRAGNPPMHQLGEAEILKMFVDAGKIDAPPQRVR